MYLIIFEKIEGGPIFAIGPYLTLPSILGYHGLAMVVTIFSRIFFFLDIPVLKEGPEVQQALAELK